MPHVIQIRRPSPLNRTIVCSCGVREAYVVLNQESQLNAMERVLQHLRDAQGARS